MFRVIISTEYNNYAQFLDAIAEWEAELEALSKIIEFPCIGAWDCFYVYV